MSYRLQTVVDSVDPHAQADWWAETLGWRVEPSDEAFIRRMVEEGHARAEDTLVYRDTLVWREAQAICPAQEVGAPDRTRMLFLVVPEGRSVKNRVHWDVVTDGADIDEVRDALVARGAAYLATHRQGPHSWHVMTDPEGNEFCVA